MPAAHMWHGLSVAGLHAQRQDSRLDMYYVCSEIKKLAFKAKTPKTEKLEIRKTEKLINRKTAKLKNQMLKTRKNVKTKNCPKTSQTFRIIARPCLVTSSTFLCHKFSYKSFQPKKINKS